MSLAFWKQVSSAIAGLNADSVVRESQVPFSIALAGSPYEVSVMEDWLVPPSLNTAQQSHARRRIYSVPVPMSPGDRSRFEQATIRLVGPSAGPMNVDHFSFHPDDAVHLTSRIVGSFPDLELALGRHFPALREAVLGRIIQRTEKENAMFAILSALPNIIPSPIELPWAIGEFASDTIVITANQTRMALAIAAACDAPVGFGEQRGQVASIMGSAFGLRAIAREIAGKVPAGGGMVAKGCIAFAGTYALGLGLSRWNREGRRPTHGERRLEYKRALESGRD